MLNSQAIITYVPVMVMDFSTISMISILDSFQVCIFLSFQANIKFEFGGDINKHSSNGGVVEDLSGNPGKHHQHP